ncbi:Uma2 family endonuclease, partial [Leptolyngbya sp. FACHB-36]|uniref:Uma2 family endonuclease n=1 Tax=Leptolyngbya sp. FACHB-36 TaxID=2692808 RepID=UPI001680DCFC
MIQYNPLQVLPTAEDLPDSDDTPVDNELQNLVPNLLLAILAIIWSERQDWFFGVDMGIYYLPETPQNALVPDGFLSVGVDRRKSDRGRLSYVMWEENYTAPVLGLEVVSQKYGGEYDTKLDKYRSLGVLYYVVYNPDFWRRDKHAPLEAYRLINNQYVLQSSEPFWMPEIGLGIGRSQGTYKNWRREWLYWFEQLSDAGFERCLSPDEWTDRIEQQLEQTEQQLEQTEQ